MVLFVCHGNVARSQFAEALLQQRGVAGVSSAGTCVPNDREGNELANDGTTAARVVDYFRTITGIDISTKRRKMVTPELAEGADVIVVMTRQTDLPEYFDKHRTKTRFWAIEDPHDTDIDGYRKAIAAINERIDGLPILRSS
jgi:protein-tyrosine-phosphatase